MSTLWWALVMIVTSASAYMAGDIAGKHAVKTSTVVVDIYETRRVYFGTCATGRPPAMYCATIDREGNR